MRWLQSELRFLTLISIITIFTVSLSIVISPALAADEPPTEPSSNTIGENSDIDILGSVTQPGATQNPQYEINETGMAQKRDIVTSNISTQASRCEQPQRGGSRAGNVYLGSDPPDYCHVLQGPSDQGNLRIHVADGLINIQRYNEEWVNQYYTYGGGLIYVDGKKTSLGYYTSDTTEPSGGWGDTGNYEEPISQSRSNSMITTTWMVDGIRIEQYITYNGGNQFYSLEWDITNTNDTPESDIRFFRGADTYLANGDFGDGFWEGQTDSVGVKKTVSGEEQKLFFRGITSPFGYRSTYYDTVVGDVESVSLENQVDSSNHDNGYALEWRDETLGPSETFNIRAIESFVRSSITVSSDSSETLDGGTAQLTYTVQNTGTSSQQVDYEVSAPELFSYTNPSSDTLPAGDSKTVTVTVDPPSSYPAGQYDISLTADGSDSQSVQAIGQLEIPEEGTSRNLPPTARFDITPPTAIADQPITFSATSSADPNGDELSYEWDFEQTGTVDATGETAVEDFTAGTQTVSLTVSDGQLSDSIDREITIEPTQQTPTASFVIENNGQEVTQPVEVGAGSVLTLDGSDSSAPANSEITSYSWSFDNGQTATGQTVRTKFRSSGTYSIRLRVTDSQGITESIQKQVSVQDTPSSPKFTRIAQPADGLIPQSSTLTGFPNTWRAYVSSDTNIERVEFEFPGAGQFVDRNGADGWKAQPNINSLNNGIVEITAYDDAGQTATDTVTISTFDLPVWANPYRTERNSDSELVVRGGGTIGPPPFSVGLLAVNAEATTTVNTYLVHPVGIRRASGGGGGDLELELKPASGPGVGTGAGLEIDGDARIREGQLRWQQATVTGKSSGTAYFVVAEPSVLGNEISIDGSVSQEIEFSGDLDVAEQVKLEQGSYTMALVVVPASFGGSAGFGAELVSIEVGGELEANGTITTDAESVSGTLGASGKLFAEGHVGIVYFSEEFGPEGQIPVGETQIPATSQTQQAESNTSQSIEWNVMNKRSAGTSSNVSADISTRSDANTDNIFSITDNDLGDREPAIEMTNSNKTVVWSAQHPDKSVTNGSEIAIRTHNNGEWDSKTYLTDNDRYETYPSIASGPEGNGIVWARANESISRSNINNPTDLVQHYDIYTGRQNGDSLSSATELTNNSLPEFSPVIAGNDDAWIVAWKQDTDRNLSTTNDRRVKYAILDNSMSNIRKSGTIASAIDVEASTHKSELTLVTRSTTGIRKLRFASDGTQLQDNKISTDTASDVAIVNQTVAWVNTSSNGPLINTSNGIEVASVPEVPAGVDQLQLVNKNDSQIIAYKANPIGENESVYYHVRDSSSMNWTGPQQIDTSEVPIRKMGVSTTNRSLNVVIESTPSVRTRADIISVEEEYPNQDLAVTARTTKTNSTSATVEAIVSNEGTNESNPSILTFQTPSGSVLTKTVPGLVAGERTNLQFDVSSPVAGKGTLQLDPSANPADTVESNNVDNIQFMTDLTVSSVEDSLTNSGSNLTVDVAISNNGSIPAQNVPVSLHANNQTKNTSVTGIASGSSFTTSINLDNSIGTSTLVTIEVNPNRSVPETQVNNNIQRVRIRSPDVGLTDSISYAPENSSQNGRKIRLMASSGDTAKPVAEIITNASNQSATYQVPLPPARAENDTTFVPTILSIPSANNSNTTDRTVSSYSNHDKRLQLVASPNTGIDTNLNNNAIIDDIPSEDNGQSSTAVSQTNYDQTYPNLNISNTSTTTNDNRVISITFSNSNDITIGEIVTIRKSGEVINQTTAVVSPSSENQIDIPLDETGQIEVQSATETKTITVGGDAVPDYFDEGEVSSEQFNEALPDGKDTDEQVVSQNVVSYIENGEINGVEYEDDELSEIVVYWLGNN